MPCTILLLLKLPELCNTLTPSSSSTHLVDVACEETRKPELQLLFQSHTYINRKARILLLTSGAQFDSVKGEIEVRKIFEYSWDNVEEQGDCLHMAVTSLAYTWQSHLWLHP